MRLLRALTLNPYPAVYIDGLFCGECRERSDCTYVQPHLALHSPVLFQKFLSTETSLCPLSQLKSAIAAVKNFNLIRQGLIIDLNNTREITHRTNVCMLIEMLTVLTPLFRLHVFNKQHLIFGKHQLNVRGFFMAVYNHCFAERLNCS